VGNPPLSSSVVEVVVVVVVVLDMILEVDSGSVLYRSHCSQLSTYTVRISATGRMIYPPLTGFVPPSRTRGPLRDVEYRAECHWTGPIA
jgi:hypothetical protein